VLESAKRRLLVVQHAVDRHAAGEELRGNAPRPLDVRPAHEGVQAEARVVGDPDRVFLGFVSDDTQDGALKSERSDNDARERAVLQRSVTVDVHVLEIEPATECVETKCPQWAASVDAGRSPAAGRGAGGVTCRNAR
jgi:hypothetical protein